jgi:hypothetical protein
MELLANSIAILALLCYFDLAPCENPHGAWVFRNPLTTNALGESEQIRYFRRHMAE